MKSRGDLIGKVVVFDTIICGFESHPLDLITTFIIIIFLKKLKIAEKNWVA